MEGKGVMNEWRIKIDSKQIVNPSVATAHIQHTLIYATILVHLSRLGAQTMARFLACMLVSDEYEAILTRCRMRNSRVLKNTHKARSDFKCATDSF